MVKINLMEKKRLDELVFHHGLAESREQARKLIMAGEVRVNGQVMSKPGALVDASSLLEVMTPPPYVSRGGLKLESALGVFQVNVDGMTAADVGASTGGFTDCLLQHGAAKVYALDVGRGQLAWKLRQDPKVVSREQVNVRYLEQLEELVHLVVIDVSFISLRLILPVVRRWLLPEGQVIALVKPQFEAGREQVGKGGVVRDKAVHHQVLVDFLGWAGSTGWTVRGLANSPILGQSGNREFFAWLVPGEAIEEDMLLQMVGRVLNTDNEG